MTKEVESLLPWSQPDDDNVFFNDDGPTKVVKFVIDGHQFQVTPTDQTGIHSGRTRFRVECLTCNEVIHEATTSATSRVKSHLREKERERNQQ